METIAGGKTPGLCLIEALPAEVVALGISICDTTRDGSRIVGYTEAILHGRRLNSVASAHLDTGIKFSAVRHTLTIHN
jgi:hypothetical protein